VRKVGALGVVNVLLRDTVSGDLLSVQRLDRYTYLTPSGHSGDDIARALDGQGDRYTYVGAEILPTRPLTPLEP
jgi:hypothetical protein